MRKTTKEINKQKIVTVVAANYVDILIPELLEKSFEAYKKRDFIKKHFQVSVIENTYATAGIVLTILALEAYRNRIYYMLNKPLNKMGLVKSLSQVFKLKEHSFPNDFFEEILTELVIVRDVIVHNHLYEVEIINDENWEMIGHRQRLLESYGDSKRLNSGLVSERTRKTRNLKLNVQPAKIGFEDLFTVLVIFDSFIGISDRILPNSYVPSRFSFKLDGSYINRLSHLLSHYYSNYSKLTSLHNLTKIYKKLKIQLVPYFTDHKDYFLKNTCPKCGDFGFHQPKKIYKCNNCNFKIELG
ncbi:MAG: hypothetical protein H6772_02205 [Pseudomonadales bacterium]|nr:hypothetical protein [Pseudomonadales bacterium]